MAKLLKPLLWIYHWILLLLRLRKEETELPPPVVEETKVPPPTEAMEKPKQKRQKSRLPETLSELLDNLEATFKHWTLPHSSMSWISKWEVRGLRKLGAYVVNADVNAWLDAAKVGSEFCFIPTECLEKFPSLMLFGFPGTTTPEFSTLRFAYAIKQEKPHKDVEQLRGVNYLFGFAFAFGRKEEKLTWLVSHVVIDPSTGKVTCCAERGPKQNIIPCRSPADRKRYGSHRVITTQTWHKPKMAAVAEWKNSDNTEETKTRAIAITFRECFRLWIDRKNQWSVSVTKNDDRVTFAVPTRSTAAYFKNRDKIVNDNGSTKRIIHYVQEHTRSTGAFVKAHIRGLREFNWNGYHCLVTSPEFHHPLTSLECDISMWNREDHPNDKGISSEKFAGLIAEMEDR